MSLHTIHRRALALAAGLLPFLAWAQAGNHTCPPTVRAQYQQVASYAPDGPQAGVLGFTPQFAPVAPLRLTLAQLGLAHGGEAVPSELLPPDELSYTLGRPMRWTLWDGRDPAPNAVVHVICEYEGGLVLHRPLGTRVRSCTLASAALRAAPPKPAAKGTKPGDKVDDKDAPPWPASLRELAARAVFSCR